MGEVEARVLGTLADEINAEHRACEEASRSGRGPRPLARSGLRGAGLAGGSRSTATVASTSQSCGVAAE
jgi:hypothetical protein